MIFAKVFVEDEKLLLEYGYLNSKPQFERGWGQTLIRLYLTSKRQFELGIRECRWRPLADSAAVQWSSRPQ